MQTDFSMTNSTGIRQDLLPGPVTVEEMYNIFPFDNSITKMQLSGVEVLEMFDFIARRSSSRACASQAQIAGARVILNCAGCARDLPPPWLSGGRPTCDVDTDCPSQRLGDCDPNTHLCKLAACAENVYIGFTNAKCQTDQDCGTDANGQVLRGSCAKSNVGDQGTCMSAISPTNLYELATSNYLAGGGSGFRVLQRNTTQVDTKIQQRDALIDYVRVGHPCGWADPKKDATRGIDGLLPCSDDVDCKGVGDFVCACPGNSTSAQLGDALVCNTTGSCNGGGRCVRRDCRDQIAAFRDRRCKDAPDLEACQIKLNPCQIGGESCKILSCVDEGEGAATDNRIQMLGR